MTIPTLSTDRLTLRPMRPDDFPAYAALMPPPDAPERMAAHGYATKACPGAESLQ